MHAYFLAAAIALILVGLVHSVFGEVLIFRRLRKAGLVPKEPAPPLQVRHIGILWATWHLASAFGFGFAYLLLSIAQGDTAPDPVIVKAMLFACLAGSMLVLIGTRGRHPGWIGLLAVAALVHLGSAA
ncbi:hypothetical protein V1318_07745 [Lysobacter sp. CCNWLW3]|uniref:hypothetical protein n=1 Tax=unclassified Lysobacter TaxID=2635362 RepID=UPI002FD31DE4